ncbi:hypothetical protein AZ270_gp21 [Acidianus tailed spindle virus]|uniref:hypothetical protein n=1 Tax=Acidianus tailed spindle virus TaxID=1797140 RepID=UPI00076F2E1F|nr:hypothetical protein AZ270_gp21 [Acidianus tailed spindle virus]AME30044.1 hypothetical protein ATSV_B256 [Acidianus tailed spindle virus]
MESPSPSPYTVSKEAMNFLNVFFSNKPIKNEKVIINALKNGFVSSVILDISPNALSEFEDIIKKYFDVDLIDDEYYKTVELGIIAMVITLLAHRVRLIELQDLAEPLNKYASYLSSLRFKAPKKDVMPLLALGLVTEEGGGFYKVTGLALYLINFLLTVNMSITLPKACLKELIEDLNNILLFHKFMVERVTSLLYEAPWSLYSAYHGSSSYDDLMAELDFESILNTLNLLREKLKPPYKYEIPVIMGERKLSQLI